MESLRFYEKNFLTRDTLKRINDKKMGFSFWQDDSIMNKHVKDCVVNVNENEYGIVYGNKKLATYNINTCYGIVFSNEKITILMHINSKMFPFDVIKLIRKIGINGNFKATFIPGVFCNDLCYGIVHDEMIKMGIFCDIYQFNGRNGNIFVNSNFIEVVSEFGLENKIPVFNQKKLVK